MTREEQTGHHRDEEPLVGIDRHRVRLGEAREAAGELLEERPRTAVARIHMQPDIVLPAHGRQRGQAIHGSGPGRAERRHDGKRQRAVRAVGP